MSTSNFKDKTVIITGASAGVGAACAELFANLGARLVLSARGEEALNVFADTLRDKTNVLAIPMDVADEAGCEALIEQAATEYGAIHVLVNNAGAHHRGAVETQTPANMAQMVDVNLRAPIYLTALALPHIRNAGGGAVVMVGSLAGRTPMQGAATYASTKAGLKAFTHSLADELMDSGINIGVVSPGPIDTAFIMGSIDEVEDIVYSQPMSTAGEVAEAVMAVANGESVEICLPTMSGRLTNLSYLSPWLRRKLRPSLYKKGAKNKEKYRNRPVVS
ncbi:SDR family oxidoreductase [Halieaceae bacterium IMCC8485]|jgi:short-subunit dehydrogenase|uniref:SDR family oxidoreductase n=1 Tax=Candidatus Seongchinamella marina TaxID=2518990 RepID=A0ABT3SQT9_9GAMM|nr:SDR family NAD(P)-dependent oxidoreductase [Candidatus Seongchinamella marina]MCX2972353.1 SDR family oxidoreductase [Candidatus Seongchinamella marina]